MTTDKVMPHPEAASLNVGPFLLASEPKPGRARGGHARAAALSPERRRAIAQAAALARWGSTGVVEPVAATIEPVRLCRLGHPLKTYASGYVRCPVCVTATTKRWREENPDRWRASQRRWREAHRDAIRSYHESWRRANLDRVRQHQRRYIERLRAEERAQ
jgi:hypothetical protein